MKQFFTFLLLCMFLSVKAQTKVMFSYDAAGNQVARQICITCKAATPNDAVVKDVTDVAQQDFTPLPGIKTMSYYPNPVKEQLYLKWTLQDNNKLTIVYLYSLSGQLLKTINKLETLNDTTIDFSSYPEGVYTLVLVYSNGENETIKIIK